MRYGRGGGDVSTADAVLLAVPGGAIADAVAKLQGLEGKTVIDATNLYNVDPPAKFASNAEFVKSKTGGPTAKSFNTNAASLYDQLGEARATPSNLWCGDDEARDVLKQLNRDAGYEPVHVGGLEKAAIQEGFAHLMFAITEGGLGLFVYRLAPPDALLTLLIGDMHGPGGGLGARTREISDAPEPRSGQGLRAMQIGIDSFAAAYDDTSLRSARRIVCATWSSRSSMPTRLDSMSSASANTIARTTSTPLPQ